MKLGIATPVLTRTAGHHAAWLSTGTIEDVAQIVSEADQLGFDFCTCSEHVGIPDVEIGRRGAAYWDPLATFGFLAARTSDIRFVTWVLVLAYHHPLELAKRYGQLDLMSNGRLVLGVGVGTLREEFDALGATFEGRGERADDAIRAIRATWGRRIPEYHGPQYDIAGLVVEPHAARTELPIWVGGRTRRSLRRAIALGDGWTPFALSFEQVAEMLAWGRARPEWERRDGPLDVMLSVSLDPLGDPDRTRRTLDAARATGATFLAVSFEADSPLHFVEHLDALAQLES
ncbi:MAG: LLM class F420-dependent oxidoreductase [Acidimicrobiia bacterium]